MVYIEVTVSVRLIYLVRERLGKWQVGRANNNGNIKINLRNIASDVDKLMAAAALKLFSGSAEFIIQVAAKGDRNL